MRYAFADCLLDTDRHELTRAGNPVEVEPQVFDLLVLLAANAGQLVTKDALVEAVWQGRIVSESAISARIAAARKVVGDDGKAQAVIRTVARKGVQMVAEVAVEVPDAPAALTIAKPRIAEMPPKPAARFARAEDGTMLAYRVIGKGPPVVLLEHFPTTMERYWLHPWSGDFCASLCQNHTVVIFDQRGCGLSAKTLDDDDAALMPKDVHSVAVAAGFERYGLIGRSGGAAFSALCASQNPDSVEALVLQGGYAVGRALRDGATAVADSIEAMQREGWDTPGSPFIEGYIRVYFPDAGPADVHATGEGLRQSCPIENALWGRRTHNHVDIRDQLASIKAPTLVAQSAGDAVHPLEQAQILAAGIPGAELITFDSRNHYVLSHEPAWPDQLDAILGHLARHMS